ncbi:MAG: NAD(+)/NADH kinase [Candidatus Vogelbacteria bacterium]|nr:NAD(+)/NADH kinase [Candidatus Vogelbacteria bacterium]
MKILIYGKEVDKIKLELLAHGFQIVESNPDAVVCYGGDGTLLHAEYTYPGVLKLPLRNSKVGKLCAAEPIGEVLRKFITGKYKIAKIPKLEFELSHKKHFALNDVIIANKKRVHAIRYVVRINEKLYAKGREIIGDGIVVATPFGSGAYYRSITDGTFSVGIGLAFNNSTESVDHVVLKDTDLIEFEITRGEAVVAADIDELGCLNVGDKLTISKSKKESAKIATFGEEFSYWAND